jgi:hypothetical protein
MCVVTEVFGAETYIILPRLYIFLILLKVSRPTRQHNLSTLLQVSVNLQQNIETKLDSML